MLNFKVIHKDTQSSARTGLLTTAHGQIQTPAFMPVGTAGAVKGIIPKMIEETGAEIILANTYHLFLRPGVEVIEELGGLGKFMGWNKPILTDSGGYQIFSLNSLVKIDDDGVEFASHINGKKVYLSPEKATEIQNCFGVDIIMCFDQCTEFSAGLKEHEKAVERTIRWAKRCKNAHSNTKQMLFGIVQGGINPDLRTYCASELVKMDFSGYAIGGLSVGEGHDDMIKTVRHTVPFLPKDRPVYLMGVGMPKDIIAAVQAGVDMFDCVLPTRNGRNAFAFTWDGPVRLRNNSHISDSGPIENCCDCYCCQNFSRGSLRHFFKSSEMLGPILVSLHNLRFYQRLMTQIREAVRNNKINDLAARINY